MFQAYLNSIKTPDIQFQELYDNDSLYDADLLLNTFSNLPIPNSDYDYADEDFTPCSLMENTKCSEKYEPVCVTDLHCIYVLKNKCLLDKLNCKCSKYIVVIV